MKPMEIDTTATITLKRSFRNVLIPLPVFVFFVIGGYHISNGTIANIDFFSFEFAFGATLILLTCVFGTLWLLEIVCNPLLVIEVGPEGILDRRVSRNYILWSKIRKVFPKNVHGANFLMLEFDKAFETELKHQWRYGLSRCLNRLFGVMSHYIHAYGFGIDINEFQNLVEIYAKAHVAPAATE